MAATAETAGTGSRGRLPQRPLAQRAHDGRNRKRPLLGNRSIEAMVAQVSGSIAGDVREPNTSMPGIASPLLGISRDSG